VKRADRIILPAVSLVFAVAGYAIYGWVTAPHYYTAPAEARIEVKYNPRQETIEDVSIPVIRIGSNDIYLFALAGYDISAVLVSKRKYRSGFMHELSPWDYALVWGSVPQYLEYLEFNQIIRFCLFTARADIPIDPGYVQVHMSNNHLIPANRNIRRALPLARVGDEVRISGYLVHAQAVGKTGSVTNWQSSTSRTDTGNGACEIIYVTALRIGDRIYE